MPIPTPFLDSLILMSAAYPAGFSHALFTFRRGAPREVSTAFLAFLTFPFLVVIPSVWAVRPGLVAFRGATAALLAVAVLLAPVALLVEYGLQAAAVYRATGRLPRGLAVVTFWRRRLSITDHLLLLAVTVGEEVFYREIWLGTLAQSFGAGVPAALAISSLAYGMNHLAFGGASVLAKSVSGLLYGGLYLFGGGSIWLPILTHAIQNLALLHLPRNGNA